MRRQPLFADRAEAGQRLAERLAGASFDRPIVYALPRGGVPVAAPVAKTLGAPLALLIVRKIGVPSFPELAAGSVVDGDPPEIVWNEDVLLAARMNEAASKAAAETATRELREKAARYPATLTPADARGRDALIVDDGIATGASVRAAIAALRRHEPRRVIVATPVAPAETIEALAAIVDEIVCVATPAHFGSVGAFYEDFRQLDDADVVALIKG